MVKKIDSVRLYGNKNDDEEPECDAAIHHHLADCVHLRTPSLHCNLDCIVQTGQQDLLLGSVTNYIVIP